MKEIRMLKEKGKPDGVKERTDGLVAAMKIQKVWRGFATRYVCNGKFKIISYTYILVLLNL